MTGLVTLGETLALVASATPGPLAHETSLTLGIGGAESNVAIGVRRLGGSAIWIGRVGADPLGARIVRELRAEDVVVHAVVDPDVPTALMIKERRTSDTGRVWYYRSGNAGSRLSPEDLPPSLIEAAALLHVTGITPGLSPSARAATYAAVEQATAAGIPVSFDVNHRAGVWGERDPAPVYARLARTAAVVFAGEDEARLLTGTDPGDPETLAADLAATTGGDVVLKLGAAGCLAVIDGCRWQVEAVPVRVVDPVGAGDAFVAGYLAEFMQGLAPAERLETAVRCGALACAGAGDWESLPTRADLALLGAPEGIRR